MSWSETTNNCMQSWRRLNLWSGTYNQSIRKWSRNITKWVESYWNWREDRPAHWWIWIPLSHETSAIINFRDLPLSSSPRPSTCLRASIWNSRNNKYCWRKYKVNMRKGWQLFNKKSYIPVINYQRLRQSSSKFDVRCSHLKVENNMLKN